MFYCELEVDMYGVFRGRDAELKLLDRKYNQSGFNMVVLYGRRRVGKTRLVNQFIKEHDGKYISFMYWCLCRISNLAVQFNHF